MLTVKIKDKEINLSDSEAALILALQELTQAIKYLNTKNG